MTQKIDPFLQTKWGWSDGENAWGNGMNENLIKFSFLLNRRLDGIVSSISTTPVSDGLAYFLTTDKHVYFSGDGVWYNTALPIGFELIMKADESHYEYNGTTLVPSSVSGSVDWADLTGKPSTFPPSTHTHIISDVTGLQTALDAKVDKVGGKGLSTEDYTTAEKSKLAGIAAGAEVNTISSVGSGTASLVSGKVGVDLQIKSLVAGSNITFSQTGTEVTINSSTGGVGVVNSVNGYTGTVTLTNADLGSTPTTRAITAGNGLTGGGDLSTNRTIALGTPSTISTASTNSSSGTTHTHLLTLSAADIGAVDLSTLNTRLGTSGNLGTLALQNANSVTISGGTINNTSIGATTRSTGNFTNIDLNGNLTLSGTAKRILGDFSNATFANRLSFQTSTVNGGTGLQIIPNGTGTTGNITAYNNSDPTNSGFLQLSSSPSAADINSGIRGTGTYLPLNISTGGAQAIGIDTSQNVSLSSNLILTGLGKRVLGDFSNATIANRLHFQTSTLNSTTSFGVIPNGTSTNANITASNNSDPTNCSYLQIAASATTVGINSGVRGTGAVLPIAINISGVGDALVIDTSANTSITGDLNLTGVGKRIKSDFSNATILSRTLVQTSTVNSATRFDVIPNGTGTTANIGAFNNSDPTNSSWARLTATASDIRVESTISGTGTYLPLNLYNSGVVQLSIATTGTITATNGIIAHNLSSLGSNSGDTIDVVAGAYNYFSAPSYSGSLLRHYGTSVAGNYGSTGLVNANLGVMMFQNVSSGLVTTNGANLYLGANNLATMILTNAGKVGIGTNSPTQALHVVGSTYTSGSFYGDATGLTGNGSGLTNLNYSQLSYIPVQQGGGIGQSTNKIYIGWSSGGKLKGTVDSTDLGNIALESFTTNASNLLSGTVASGRLPFTYTTSTTASTVAQRDGAGDLYAHSLIASGGTITGDGSPITNINANNISSGVLSTARLPFPVSVSGSDLTFGGNLYSDGGSIRAGSTSGVFTVYRYDGHISLNGGVFYSLLTDNSGLNASNLTSGTVPNARLNTASTSAAGIVQLSDSTGSPSSTTAATSLAVNTVANTASNANNTANNAISRLDGQYQAPFQLLNILGNVSGTATITASSGTHVKATCVGNTTWVFPSVASGNAMALTLELTNGGAGVQTWPSGTLWAGGVQPTWTVSGKDRVVFTKAGTDPWFGALAGKGFA